MVIHRPQTPQRIVVRGSKAGESIGANCHSASAKRMPSSTSRSLRAESRPIRSVRKLLSSVTIWETLTTDARPRPTLWLDSATFPGAIASFVFDVIAAATTVRIRLRLNSSACITTTGRRKPGSEPEGFGRSVHHTSPRRTTSLLWPAFYVVMLRDQSQDLILNRHQRHRSDQVSR
jgi:hypothetical protein